MHQFFTFLLGVSLINVSMSADSAGVELLENFLDDNIKDHKAPRSVDPDEILADIDLSDDAGPAGSEGVVIIAHMVNSMESAKWGIASGANGVEFDVDWMGPGTERGGAGSGPVPFQVYHKAICDCTFDLRSLVGSSENVCRFGGPQMCEASAPIVDILQYFATAAPDRLAIVYVDSKTPRITGTEDQKKQAGEAMAEVLFTNLFNKGYTGRVVIAGGTNGKNGADYTAYLKAASDYFSVGAGKAFDGRVAFDFGEGTVADCVPKLSFTKYRLFSTGITAMAPDWAKGFHDDIKLASYNANRGLLSDAPGIWTVDKPSTQEAYLDSGARQLMTNAPAAAVQTALARGFKLMKPGGLWTAATVSDVAPFPSAKCDCSYSKGGCTITTPAPAGTACRCKYKGAWTCGGDVVSCKDGTSAVCKAPGRDATSCVQGGGDCAGYSDMKCDCSYKPGGCQITTAAPANFACKCIYLGAWTCKGEINRCSNEGSPQCKAPDTSFTSCLLGGNGDCDGYKDNTCDCNYKRKGWSGGCIISKVAPKGTACRCTYKGAWTCGGSVTRCSTEAAAQCTSPDSSIWSCRQGGGDCGGY